eukprot:gene11742-24625_t
MLTQAAWRPPMLHEEETREIQLQMTTRVQHDQTTGKRRSERTAEEEQQKERSTKRPNVGTRSQGALSKAPAGRRPTVRNLVEQHRQQLMQDGETGPTITGALDEETATMQVTTALDEPTTTQHQPMTVRTPASGAWSQLMSTPIEIRTHMGPHTEEETAKQNKTRSQAEKDARNMLIMLPAGTMTGDGSIQTRCIYPGEPQEGENNAGTDLTNQ